MSPLTAALTVVVATAAAAAQDAVLDVRVLGDVTPAQPDVAVELWVHFPAEDYAFALAEYELFTGSSGFFGEVTQCMCDIWHGSGLRVTGRSIWSRAGQSHLPELCPALCVIADPSNPIRILSAVWRPDDFTPRIVELTTETAQFLVYPSRGSSDQASRLTGLVEPGARIRVLDRECYVDCDGSGALDLFDFLCFQNMFGAAEPLADCDLNGALDLFDFLCFQNDFAAGCP